jgi:hypothetical protein
VFICKNIQGVFQKGSGDSHRKTKQACIPINLAGSSLKWVRATSHRIRQATVNSKKKTTTTTKKQLVVIATILLPVS